MLYFGNIILLIILRLRGTNDGSDDNMLSRGLEPNGRHGRDLLLLRHVVFKRHIRNVLPSSHLRDKVIKQPPQASINQAGSEMEY